MFYLILLLILIPVIIAWSSLAPWLPTRTQDLERINKIADLKPGETFLEMGSGNARVCSYIARQNPKAKVIGIELAYFFYLFSRIRVALFGPKNLQIIFGNALKYDISNVDVIYTYALIHTLNDKIKKKVNAEMKKDARLISYVFSMKEWDGPQQKHKGEQDSLAINVYQKA